ncbi:MAG: fatty acid hydroxylase [Candidatus Rokuibacteriota bacterium]|nr:MAG: fatty acid hydroxylase [Candidatus Rokubacteria bacterium]
MPAASGESSASAGCGLRGPPVIVDRSFRRGRTHDLSRMSRADLLKAFFLDSTVLTYVVMAAVGGGLAVRWAGTVWPPLVAVALTALLYPLAEYGLHRCVLHGRFLYKARLTASLWKRIHFDHHRDPYDLRVLFGALYTTVPTIALITVPVGWAVGGRAGASAAFAAGSLIISLYEFCHCVQHLRYAPKSRFLQRIKRHHLAHHFHNERGNYGITSVVWDRVFGTLYERTTGVPPSATVFNLGYTAIEAKRYPWVAELSAGARRDGDPRRVGTE